MSRVAYYTASTLDGFIATPDHSLEWLLSRDIDPQGPMSHDSFSEGVGACVMGANTWQFTDAAVSEVHAEMVAAADGKDLWVVGGGDLAGQWYDAGLLDEVWLQYAPVTLGQGAPVLPRHAELRLLDVARNRDFVCARLEVVGPGA